MAHRTKRDPSIIHEFSERRLKVLPTGRACGWGPLQYDRKVELFLQQGLYA